ncbi:Chromosome partitioning ATPase, Mrp family, contains Fe-S cluster [Geodermatophilus pulveris]|uniref:Chromosome partitioning ATPase, Mrp family, contains Fe-S cluster n=1 Tax=Geodermatophilus pulveris TaxID=1564159 RepID=A0A239J8P9_9ACTN|nr:hypothetical protein [Geodermatophilus pulveris]SNT01653.1 Chromosome partitioning ATPase, Mrp family, contains Fe-S cluster [Geodermatophilus pulveris]
MRPTRARGAGALTGALAGALLLGVPAGLLAAASADPVGASALVLSRPDPAVVEQIASGTGSGSVGGRNDSYLEAELVRLGSADLAALVARSLSASGPVDLQANRVGESNAVEITAVSDDPQAALAQAQAAAEVYTRDRQARLLARIDAQVVVLDEQIEATETALDELDPAPATGPDPVERQRERLEDHYAAQLVTRDLLQRAVAEAPEVAAAVQPARLLATGRVSEGVTAGLGAAALGALAGATVPGLRAALHGRLRGRHDLVDLGVPVLSPALPRRRPSTHSSGELERVVQLHALQLPAGPSAGGSLAVLAATAGVGTTFTAVQHARHAARHRPTLLVCAAGQSTALDALGTPRPHADPVAAGVTWDVLTAAGPDAEELVRAAARTVVPNLAVVLWEPGDATAVAQAAAGGLADAAAAAGWALVVDTPPLDASDLGIAVARSCREVLLVAASDRSTVEEVEQALDALRSAGATVSGIVVDDPLPPSRTVTGTRSGPAPAGAVTHQSTIG